jgi:hypothetical protein
MKGTPGHGAEEFQPLPEYDHDISDAMRQVVERYLDKASDALIEAYRAPREEERP